MKIAIARIDRSQNVQSPDFNTNPITNYWKAETTERKVLHVKRFDLVSTPMGLKVVAYGLVTSWLCLAVFTFEDLWILLTGDLPRLGLYGLWYLFLGGVAAAFSVMCVVLWRPPIAKLMAALFSLSMISHVLERTVTFPIPELRTIAIARVLVSVGVVLVSFRYRVQQSDQG